MMKKVYVMPITESTYIRMSGVLMGSGDSGPLSTPKGIGDFSGNPFNRAPKF